MPPLPLYSRPANRPPSSSHAAAASPKSNWVALFPFILSWFCRASISRLGCGGVCEQHRVGRLCGVSIYNLISLMSGVRRQIVHMANMQSLLEEYDRENKFLNQQVLQLISENAVLRIDRAKANVLADFLHNRNKHAPKTPNKHTVLRELQDSNAKERQEKQEKQEREEKGTESTKRMERTSSKKIIQKFKMEEEAVQTSVVKRDEAVQTPPPLPTPQTQAEQQVQINTGNAEEKPFSFRHPAHAPFESESVSSKEIISQIDLKFAQSPSQALREEGNGESGVVLAPQLGRASSNALLPTHSPLRREGSADLRSTHAIRPSPQLDLSSKNRQILAASAQKELPRDGSRTKMRPFQSVQKRKRFLQVMSVSATAARVWRSKGEDCC